MLGKKSAESRKLLETGDIAGGLLCPPCNAGAT